MRSTEVREPIESTGVYTGCPKHGQELSTESTAQGIQLESVAEGSANRQWQNTWRCKHPIIRRNQSWLYRTTRKIHAELMDAFLTDFPELGAKQDLLYWKIMEDLKDAFPDEWETRKDYLPRLISAIEPVLSLPRTQMLLKSFQIPCDVFYSSLDARRIQTGFRAPLHPRMADLTLEGHRAFMHLIVRVIRHLNGLQRSRLKKETRGETEAMSLLRYQRRRMIGFVSLFPVGPASLDPRVAKVLVKIMEARQMR